MNSMKLLSKNPIQNGIVSRFYCTNRVNKGRLFLGYCYDKTIKEELDDLLRTRTKIGVGELQLEALDLCREKSYTKALQVFEWMNEKGVRALIPAGHATMLSLLGRACGFLSAKSYFDNLKDGNKTYVTFVALLYCYVEHCQTDKSFSHFQKMELGIASSPLTYNNIMCLYTNIRQHEKVPDVMREMKENKVSPD